MREKSILARNIQRLRKAQGWSKEQLAEKVDCSPYAIAEYENGRREPNCKALVALERVFQVTGAQLCGLEPVGHHSPKQAAHIAVSLDNGGANGDYTSLLIVCQDCGEMIYSGTHAPGIETSIELQHICRCGKTRKAVE